MYNANMKNMLQKTLIVSLAAITMACGLTVFTSVASAQYYSYDQNAQYYPYQSYTYPSYSYPDYSYSSYPNYTYPSYQYQYNYPSYGYQNQYPSQYPYYYDQRPYSNYGYPSYELPSVTVYCSANVNTAYPGQMVTWTAYPSGGNGYYSFDWTGENVSNNNSASAFATYYIPGTKSPTVTVSSGNKHIKQGCSSITVLDPQPSYRSWWPW
jgi:hypothetical protein